MRAQYAQRNRVLVGASLRKFVSEICTLEQFSPSGTRN